MSGSSYWPRSAVYVQGIAPLSRIHATATEVSSPPENAMPTRAPFGRVVRTLDIQSLPLVAEEDVGACSSARDKNRRATASPPLGSRVITSTVSSPAMVPSTE